MEPQTRIAISLAISNLIQVKSECAHACVCVCVCCVVCVCAWNIITVNNIMEGGSFYARILKILIIAQ